MNITLKQLRAFVTIAETEHVTRAADKLELSQSAVSTLIGQLEKNFGLRLFDRHTRSLRLTSAGSEMLPIAKRAVLDIEGMVENAANLTSLRRGSVSIAAGTLQAALLLPRLIRKFTAEFPNVSVEIHDVSEKVVNEMVRNGTVDFGIGTFVEGAGDIGGTKLTTEEFLVVMRPDDHLATRPELQWRDLTDAALIGPQPGNPIRQRLEAELARAGISLGFKRNMQEVALPLTIIGMVEGGLGVAIMTTSVNRLAHSMGLITRTPIAPIILRDISIITRHDRSLSPAAVQLRDFILRSNRKIASQVSGNVR